MKFKYYAPIILAVILGYLCASYALDEYNMNYKDIPNNIYYLQIGAYTNKDNIEKDLPNIKNKLIVKEEDKYYVYVGITSDYENALKIRDLYKEKNVNLYIKDGYINNKDFILELEQYDILIKNSKTYEEVNSILKTILATLEEVS